MIVYAQGRCVASVPLCMCGNWRTTLWIQSFFQLYMFPGIELKLPGLHEKHFTDTLNHFSLCVSLSLSPLPTPTVSLTYLSVSHPHLPASSI